MSSRQQILNLIDTHFKESFKDKPFIPGQSKIPVSGRVFDEDDIKLLVDASLDFWLTTGRYAEEFEKVFSDFLGIRYANLVNSGSSANLVAISSLTSPKLGNKRLKPGDEVITVAAGFPTTLNPIIQNNLVPVFVDVLPHTYNADPDEIEKAITKKTKAIFLAHTLGNPFQISQIRAIADKFNLWLIEDCCDALGSKYDNQMVGTFGDISTFSFYPAHHITMGEGGCVCTDNSKLSKIIMSFRDWGRDCWCQPGHDDTCGKRFNWEFDNLPHGYDHKYVYTHIGYNLKVTDMQAAIGVSQMKKLPDFIKKRQENFNYLTNRLSGLQDYFHLPEKTLNSDPSWFGFPIVITKNSDFTRNELQVFLNQRKIDTRLLFGGNLIQQPASKEFSFHTLTDLPFTNFIKANVFWLGVYPGITFAMIDYITESLNTFIHKKP